MSLSLRDWEITLRDACKKRSRLVLLRVIDMASFLRTSQKRRSAGMGLGCFWSRRITLVHNGSGDESAETSTFFARWTHHSHLRHTCIWMGRSWSCAIAEALLLYWLSQELHSQTRSSGLGQVSIVPLSTLWRRWWSSSGKLKFHLEWHRQHPSFGHHGHCRPLLLLVVTSRYKYKHKHKDLWWAQQH